MAEAPKIIRLKVAIGGAVQGVGFRPFVYRLARELGLKGRVHNSGEGVFVEAEGAGEALEQFLKELRHAAPPRSRITSLEPTWLPAAGLGEFQIVESTATGPKRTLVLPDIATCSECESELFDPSDRRYFYPFTNCVHCGPRFSIIRGLPYDRPNTSMREFTMCPACQAEYESPENRRFHAQPNCCPECGPHIELWDAAGSTVAMGKGAAAAREVLERVAVALASGQVVALKGLGGFHLLVDAANQTAVRTLRERKRREEKPFAVMFPTISSIRESCALSDAEESILAGPERPILLVRKKGVGGIAPGVSPGNPTLGVMLPYTPLHLLLLRLFARPVVATSGNLSDEPICTDEHEAVSRLSGIADQYLVHNRPIVRHVDDSIVRVVAGREMVLRRARGYAPLPVHLAGEPLPGPVIAVGAQLKNAVGLGIGNSVFLSQHIGDLETEAAFRAFEQAAVDLPTLYEATPAKVAADAHPDYLSTRYAVGRAGGKIVPVQHHVAHVLGCMAENELAPPVLGVAWDGTGYGLDGTVWGGEFFEVTEQACNRVVSLRPFQLPGGEAAVKEPRRSAAGVLFEIFGEDFLDHETPSTAAFSKAEAEVLRKMLVRGTNAPTTSSAGRLFDAVSSLLGIRQITRHEGQAAMELEFAADGVATTRHYPVALRTDAECNSALRQIQNLRYGRLDWEPVIRGILQDLGNGVARGEIAAVFHNTLAEWMVQVAQQAGHKQVVLSGGCFQNVRLLETAIARLQAGGFIPFWPQRVPPNDGGIALGQVIAAAHYPHLRPDGAQTAENLGAARPGEPS